MAQIFNAVAKVDELMERFDAVNVEYADYDEKVDKAFAECGTCGMGLIAKREALRDSREKIEKAIYKKIYDAVKMMEPNKYEYRDAEIMKNCAGRYDMKMTVSYFKSMAIEQAGRLEVR